MMDSIVGYICVRLSALHVIPVIQSAFSPIGSESEILKQVQDDIVKKTIRERRTRYYRTLVRSVGISRERLNRLLGTAYYLHIHSDFRRSVTLFPLLAGSGSTRWCDPLADRTLSYSHGRSDQASCICIVLVGSSLGPALMFLLQQAEDEHPILGWSCFERRDK